MIQMLSVASQSLPFSQQVVLQFITGGFTLCSGLLGIFLMFKFLPRILEMMNDFLGKQAPRDYKCNCERCRAMLRTKKGLKAWKKDHKFKKEDGI